MYLVENGIPEQLLCGLGQGEEEGLHEVMVLF